MSVEAAEAPSAVFAGPSRFAIPFLPAVSLAIMISLVFIAVFAPALAPHSERHGLLQNSLEPPVFNGGTTSFLLGTDIHGRYQLSRVIYGARISMSVVAIVLIFKPLIGVGLGLIAGFFGGMWD